MAAPLRNSRALLLSGTALSRGSCREATLFAGEYATGHGATLFMISTCGPISGMTRVRSASISAPLCRRWIL